MGITQYMKRGLLSVGLAAGQMFNTAYAETPVSQPNVETISQDGLEGKLKISRLEEEAVESKAAQPSIDVIDSQRAEDKTESKNGKWSIGIGECTYWSGLASEKPLVAIEKSTGMNIRTFTDIRDDGYLSDMFVLVSRDLNDKLAVYGAVGGAMTKIKNKKDNGLSIDLWREEVYGALGLTWHPLGRPTETGLKGIKPIVDLEGGVTYSGAGVEFGLFGKKVFEENAHDIFAYFNPRVGVEVLLMKKNPQRKHFGNKEVSVVAEVGELIPSMNKPEYGGHNAAVYTRVKW